VRKSLIEELDRGLAASFYTPIYLRWQRGLLRLLLRVFFQSRHRLVRVVFPTRSMTRDMRFRITRCRISDVRGVAMLDGGVVTTPPRLFSFVTGRRHTAASKTQIPRRFANSGMSRTRICADFYLCSFFFSYYFFWVLGPTLFFFSLVPALYFTFRLSLGSFFVCTSPTKPFLRWLLPCPCSNYGFFSSYYLLDVFIDFSPLLCNRPS